MHRIQPKDRFEDERRNKFPNIKEIDKKKTYFFYEYHDIEINKF